MTINITKTAPALDISTAVESLPRITVTVRDFDDAGNQLVGTERAWVEGTCIVQVTGDITATELFSLSLALKDVPTAVMTNAEKTTYLQLTAKLYNALRKAATND